MQFAPSLLITDDDRDFRETLRDVFQPRGCRTLLAADGEEALRIVQHDEIHLVLIDLHMPRLNGAEAIAQIKELRAELPCILLSGELDEAKRVGAGAFDILGKPVTRAQVTQIVVDALRTTYNWSGKL
ncbi:MAG: response regulator [Planctomycetales bacterium]|nr:response regulator [Planctomycetales bacterium]